MLIKTGTSSFIQDKPQPPALQPQKIQPAQNPSQQQIPAPIMVQQQMMQPMYQPMMQPMMQQPQAMVPLGGSQIQPGMPMQGGMQLTEEQMKMMYPIANMMQSQTNIGNGGMMPSQQSFQQFPPQMQSYPTMPFMAPQPEINPKFRGLTQEEVDLLPKDASNSKVPIKIYCPKCRTVVLTSCEKKWGCGACLCCCGFFFVPCGPCCLICMIDYCKDQHHTCPECRQEVGKRTYCCC